VWCVGSLIEKTVIESALIVSGSKRGTAFFTEFLKGAAVSSIGSVTSCLEARRQFAENDYGLYVVNAPLRDESGEQFSRLVAASGQAQVILVVQYEHYGAVSAVCVPEGVLTIAKPVDNNQLWAAINLADAVLTQIRKVREENSRLLQQVEDIRIIDRAKLLLIAQLKLSEPEAHRFIEKQAMDMRSSRREIAKRIIQTYEN
jgi:response regulator NasT